MKRAPSDWKKTFIDDEDIYQSKKIIDSHLELNGGQFSKHKEWLKVFSQTKYIKWGQ